ncbi:MAG: MIP/aquaporin family protein, partial [Streptomyces sp.]
MAERSTQTGPRRRGYQEGIGGELLAEFLGTFVLILIGCGSVAVAVAGLPLSGRQAGEFGPANWLIISWGWGLAVVFGVYVAGGISGAHINPAVSLGFAVRGHFPWKKVLPYWGAQVVGAFVAASVVYATYHWAIDAFNTKAGIGREESLPTFSIFATFPAEYFG